MALTKQERFDALIIARDYEILVTRTWWSPFGGVSAKVLGTRTKKLSELQYYYLANRRNNFIELKRKVSNNAVVVTLSEKGKTKLSSLKSVSPTKPKTKRKMMKTSPDLIRELNKIRETAELEIRSLFETLVAAAIDPIVMFDMDKTINVCLDFGGTHGANSTYLRGIQLANDNRIWIITSEGRNGEPRYLNNGYGTDDTDEGVLLTILERLEEIVPKMLKKQTAR